MYDFTKKTVEEDSNVMILFSSNESCPNPTGICGEVDGVCKA